ncbi:MAG: bifunctional diaminohydroxyphosphoribosylaminopyrimidine deaminase/5-amino-6-(5-phosphoribosylamino)uracil reductase RibD [Planctomycetales bacterium]|nr:bifunctional diaminohydroxyphosphoribosylaminopyrimidine deaminase/5-amino-6-(5-phosphoribosylamino)uracil reductase RibD [Planctomycetales bacterium]MBN8627174.1 bifunctional diaminohydroxyphosphoribosylaminopyrimidine deaminase/5-amino-6-(5-phosphoribosylamino)uracil reductase RibD [Planctomycetota bacterium]
MPELDAWHMARALDLALQGRGRVEPNPMVGCVIAHGAEIVGEGYHRKYGGPHAEVEALRVAGKRARGATAFVTLEPCCHHGKTPPCTDALLAAGVARVVYAMDDPFPQVAGGGAAQLRAAGVDVERGVLEPDARAINAPYLKLLERKRPWIIAKWAMTLDGRIAAASGDSKWISGEASRAVVHELRGRCDAVMIGAGTARADDPLLTARPSGVRIATRIIVDDAASLAIQSRLVASLAEGPVLVAAAESAPADAVQTLRTAGVEVLQLCGASRNDRLTALLDELGRRRMTNVLVEGGAKLFGTLMDLGEVDEVHTFIAPKLIGGAGAPAPIAGAGLAPMADALKLADVETRQLGDDVYISGRLRKS